MNADERDAVATQFHVAPDQVERDHLISHLLAVLSDRFSEKVQLLSSLGRSLWPTERHSLIQRYSDAPPAELIVPTLPAFVAGKTATWHDRQAPRDLWDLWALNNIGAINDAAAELYPRYGPTGGRPGSYLFKVPPAEADWQSQLAGQTRLTVTASAALKQVRAAWERVTRD